jgi:starch synthase
MITRIDEQKGIPLILETLGKILKENIHFVLLGEGNPALKQKLNEIAKKHSKKFSLILGFNEELAHKIEAASDIFLMPSLNEPCGLNAIYSLAYGAIPVVRGTGGLKNIIEDIDEKKLTGNGFVFKNYKGTDFIKAIKRAIELYKNQKAWEKIAVRNMKEDYSWKKLVKQYDEIYRNLTK